MSDVIVVALISLSGTLIGTFGGIMTSNKLTGYRIEQLEKKVEKHNNIIERMYCCENSINILDERIHETQSDMEDIKRRLESGNISNGSIA